MSPLLRIGRALGAFGFVVVAGTLGYVVLGFGILDALYQTVTTISTVGFREVHPLDAVGQVFTILLILAGAGTATPSGSSSKLSSRDIYVSTWSVGEWTDRSAG